MGTSKEERRRRYPVEGERRRARPCCITTSTRVGSGLGTATCGGNTRRKRFKPVVDESPLSGTAPADFSFARASRLSLSRVLLVLHSLKLLSRRGEGSMSLTACRHDFKYYDDSSVPRGEWVNEPFCFGGMALSIVRYLRHPGSARYLRL